VVGGQTIKLSKQGSAEIRIEAPVSGDYYITVKQKSKNNLFIDDKSISPYQIQPSNNDFEYASYQIYLEEGKHTLNLTAIEETVWLDSIYVSNEPLSELLNHENPKIQISIKSDSNYIVNSYANQSRYVLLLKSYFPSWIAMDSSEKTQQAYLANSFLTCFYVSSDKYDVQFGK
jgi:hypothetical protein